MAVQTPVVPSYAPAGAPSYAAVGASDTVPVGATGKYLMIVKNAGGSADSMVVDDPTSQSPVGSTTPLNPDITVSVPATTGERHVLLDAARLRDVNGNINITHSFTTSVTCIVYGPLNAL